MLGLPCRQCHTPFPSTLHGDTAVASPARIASFKAEMYRLMIESKLSTKEQEWYRWMIKLELSRLESRWLKQRIAFATKGILNFRTGKLRSFLPVFVVGIGFSVGGGYIVFNHIYDPWNHESFVLPLLYIFGGLLLGIYFQYNSARYHQSLVQYKQQREQLMATLVQMPSTDE
jgi:hypothetical protein